MLCLAHGVSNMIGEEMEPFLIALFSKKIFGTIRRSRFYEIQPKKGKSIGTLENPKKQGLKIFPTKSFATMVQNYEGLKLLVRI